MYLIIYERIAVLVINLLHKYFLIRSPLNSAYNKCEVVEMSTKGKLERAKSKIHRLCESFV